MTKKKSSEILVDENQKISLEKVTFFKFSTESENFLKIGGKSEKQVGKCIMASGGWTPLRMRRGGRGCGVWLEALTEKDLEDNGLEPIILHTHGCFRASLRD